MKRLSFVLLLVFCFSLPASAWELSSFRVRPTDQVVVTLLSMVANDLEMCRASIRPQLHSYGKNVLAIGHLNNAQSALRRANLDHYYRPLVAELLDRMDKIKFYLVMNDVNNVSMRLQQLVAVLQTMIQTSSGPISYPGQTDQIGQTIPGSGGPIIIENNPPISQTNPFSPPIIIVNNPVPQTPIVVLPIYPGFPTFGGTSISVGPLPNLPVIPQ